MFRESKCTYEKEGVMNLCQIDWLMLYTARNYGAFLTSLCFIGTIRVPYAKGGLKGSTFCKHLRILTALTNKYFWVIS